MFIGGLSWQTSPGKNQGRNPFIYLLATVARMTGQTRNPLLPIHGDT